MGLDDSVAGDSGRWLRRVSKLLLVSTALTGSVVGGSAAPSEALFGWGEPGDDTDDASDDGPTGGGTGLGRQDGPSTSGRIDEIGTTVSSTESLGGESSDFGNGFGNNSDRENEERAAVAEAQEAATSVVEVPVVDASDDAEAVPDDVAWTEVPVTETTATKAPVPEVVATEPADDVDAEFAAAVYGNDDSSRPGHEAKETVAGSQNELGNRVVADRESDSGSDDVVGLSDAGVATSVQDDGSVLESWYDPEADTVVDRWSDGTEVVETVFDSDGEVVSRTSENTLDGSSTSADFENGEPVAITTANPKLGLESSTPIGSGVEIVPEATLGESLDAFGGAGAPIVSSNDVVLSGADLQAKNFADRQDEKFDAFLGSLPEDLPTEEYVDRVDEYVKTVEDVERETFANTNERVEAAFTAMAESGDLTGDPERDLGYWHDQERYDLASRAMEEDYLSGAALSGKWTELKQRQTAESERVADVAAIDRQLTDINLGREASAANGEFVDLNGLVHGSQADADAVDQTVARDQGFASVADARATKDMAWAQAAVSDPPLQNADEVLENTPGIDTAIGLAEFGIGVGTLDPVVAIGGLAGALPGPNLAKLMPNSMTRPRTGVVNGPSVAANDATVDGGGSIVSDGSTSMWPTVAVGAGAAALLTSDTENLETKSLDPKNLDTQNPGAPPDAAVDVVPIIGDMPVVGDPEVPGVVTPGQPDTGDLEVIPNVEPDGRQPAMTPLAPGSTDPAWMPAAPNDENPENVDVPVPVVVPGDDGDLAIPLPWQITPETDQPADPDSAPTITMSTGGDEAGPGQDSTESGNNGENPEPNEDPDAEHTTDPAVADAMDRARGFNESALAEFNDSQRLLGSSGRSDQVRDGSPLGESSGEDLGEIGTELAEKAAIAERNAGLRALTALHVQRQAGIENTPSGDDDEVGLLRDQALTASDQAGSLRTAADVLQVRIDADEPDLHVPEGGVEGLRSQAIEADSNARRIALEALVTEAEQQTPGGSPGNAPTGDTSTEDVSNNASGVDVETNETTGTEPAQVEADELNTDALIEHGKAQRLSLTRQRISTVSDGESGGQPDTDGRSLVNEDLDRGIEIAERSAGMRALQALTIQRDAGIESAPSGDVDEIDLLRRQALEMGDQAAALRESTDPDQVQIDAGATNNVRMFNEPREVRETRDNADELEAKARSAALQALVMETDQRRSSGANTASRTIESDEDGDVQDVNAELATAQAEFEAAQQTFDQAYEVEEGLVPTEQAKMAAYQGAKAATNEAGLRLGEAEARLNELTTAPARSELIQAQTDLATAERDFQEAADTGQRDSTEAQLLDAALRVAAAEADLAQLSSPTDPVRADTSLVADLAKLTAVNEQRLADAVRQADRGDPIDQAIGNHAGDVIDSRRRLEQAQAALESMGGDRSSILQANELPVPVESNLDSRQLAANYDQLQERNGALREAVLEEGSPSAIDTYRQALTEQQEAFVALNQSLGEVSVAPADEETQSVEQREAELRRANYRLEAAVRRAEATPGNQQIDGLERATAWAVTKEHELAQARANGPDAAAPTERSRAAELTLMRQASQQMDYADEVRRLANLANSRLTDESDASEQLAAAQSEQRARAAEKKRDATIAEVVGSGVIAAESGENLDVTYRDASSDVVWGDESLTITEGTDSSTSTQDGSSEISGSPERQEP